MNRWWGTATDSEKQAAERSSRAARRTISNLFNPIANDESEDEYLDCNLSNSFLNVDGADDGSDQASVEDDSGSTEGSNHSLETPAIMTLFHDQNEADDEEYYKKLGTLKNRNFNPKEPEFWFTGIETSMKHMGVKNQWSKREILHSLLPDQIQIEVKHILKKDQANAGTHPYRTLKMELLKLYAPKAEAAFELALSRNMSGKPSALLKQLIDDICACDEPLATKCCQRTLWGMWARKLPPTIRQKIAGHTFNQTTYKEIMDLADASYETSLVQTVPVAAVAAAPANPPASLDETQPALQYAVNAATRGNRGQGRGGRGYRGNRGNRGGQNQNRNQNN